jgi:hypothetical protein
LLSCCCRRRRRRRRSYAHWARFPFFSNSLCCLSLRSAAWPETALTPCLLAYSPVCWACTWFDWASLPPSPASRRISHHVRLIPYTPPLLRPGRTRSLLTRALEPRCLLPRLSFAAHPQLPSSPPTACPLLPSLVVHSSASRHSGPNVAWASIPPLRNKRAA